MPGETSISYKIITGNFLAIKMSVTTEGPTLKDYKQQDTLQKTLQDTQQNMLQKTLQKTL